MLVPIVTIGASNFAVQWDSEKTGLTGKIAGIDLAAEDKEEDVPLYGSQKKRKREKETDSSLETMLSSLDELDLSNILHPKKEELEEEPNQNKPDHSSPEIYCYQSEDAASVSITPYPTFVGLPTEPDEPEYRIHHRNFKRRIPLCRGRRR